MMCAVCRDPCFSALCGAPENGQEVAVSISSLNGQEQLLAHLAMIASLTPSDEQAVLNLPLRTQSKAPNSAVICDGAVTHEACVLLRGFAFRQKMLPNGSRQILAFHMPG